MKDATAAVAAAVLCRHCSNFLHWVSWVSFRPVPPCTDATRQKRVHVNYVVLLAACCLSAVAVGCPAAGVGSTAATGTAATFVYYACNGPSCSVQLRRLWCPLAFLNLVLHVQAASCVPGPAVELRVLLLQVKAALPRHST